MNSGPYSDVFIDCIRILKITHVVHVVRDMHDVFLTYSISLRMSCIPDAMEEIYRARFFAIKGFHVTEILPVDFIHCYFSFMKSVTAHNSILN